MSTGSVTERTRKLNSSSLKPGNILYWMSRDQRVADNWALLFALELARRNRTTVTVIFCLVPQFLGVTIRQYEFMLRGLEDVERSLREKNMLFHLESGDPPDLIPRFIQEQEVGALVSDFDPLRIKRFWKSRILKEIDVPFYEVDAHNIVPCWVASGKQEYAAYTIRPKIERVLSGFLDEFATLRRRKLGSVDDYPMVDWKEAMAGLEVDKSVDTVGWIKPGEAEAVRALKRFVENGLEGYVDGSNDPNSGANSGLSPYLHFGQLSPQRVALEVMAADVPKEAKEAFLEELIVRRELSDNLCLYNEAYDRFEGFPGWAKSTLDDHRADDRPYLYDREQLEEGTTHDDLWNAAQLEMSVTGKMHGYMRMYWAKKILEWTRSPEESMEIAIYLNDKYELDGRDPNGYAGIAWSIGGVHDRAWKERDVFGKIRYMSYEGCRRKFDVKRYIDRIRGIAGGPDS